MLMLPSQEKQFVVEIAILMLEFKNISNMGNFSFVSHDMESQIWGLSCAIC